MSHLEELKKLKEAMSVPCGYEECHRDKLCGACEFGLKAIDRAFSLGGKSVVAQLLEAVKETEKDPCTCYHHGTFRSCECWTREEGRMEARSQLIAKAIQLGVMEKTGV